MSPEIALDAEAIRGRARGDGILSYDVATFDQAPGWPGIDPTWSSSDKDFVTTALGPSRLWATIGHGVLNEVYWPSTGEPQLRDLVFAVLTPGGFIDLKRVARYELTIPSPTVPLPSVKHTGPGYEVAIEFTPDPDRDALAMRIGVSGGDLAIFAAPRLGGTGHRNTAWVEDGVLFAEGQSGALCIASEAPFLAASAGFVGRSDGWHDLVETGRLAAINRRAENGNVALTAILPQGESNLVLAFATTALGARTHALSNLAEGYDASRTAFALGWERWADGVEQVHPAEDIARAAMISATVLKTHEDRTFPGAIVASLSIPWGNASDSSGGYHLVWPRDAALSAFALIATHQIQDARGILAHLIATHTPDGGWAQCAFPDGTAYWTGEQLDEVAFPILLAAKLAELGAEELPGTGAMVRAAVGDLLRKGPVTAQDRWEENAGLSPFTLAADIAALVAAEPWLTDGLKEEALDVADERNERLEAWCAATSAGQRHYVRIGPVASEGGLGGCVDLRNRYGVSVPAAELLGLDYSYLVRLGLRAGDDPVVLRTTALVDQTLRVDLPAGPLFKRYNGDGYGEHADGGAFDGTGIGRLWPLLAGERGHLALAAGEDPTPYLKAMIGASSKGGLIPEQAWDGPPLPDLGLLPGRPSGSAMPLVWAHAELIKLAAAAVCGQPVETIETVKARFAQPRAAKAWRWRTEVPMGALPPERALVVEDDGPFTLHVGFDGWSEIADIAAAPTTFGIHAVRLEAETLRGHRSIEFTRRYPSGWEGRDHTVEIEQAK